MGKTRGIRNNNPGNIRWGKDDWQGLALQKDRTDKSFCQFTAPKWGIRALAIILKNYYRKHGLATVSGIISRWAPPSENDTQKYIDFVCAKTGYLPNQQLNVLNSSTLIALISAIVHFENGVQPYPLTLLENAVKLA